MAVYHNSHSSIYRKPFGAVKTEEKVYLALKVEGESPKSVSVRVWFDEKEEIFEMAENNGVYSSTLKMPEKPMLFWYYFIIEVEGKTLYYSNNDEGLGGEGVLTDYPTGKSYQITVYDRNFKTPEWFKETVMYQIFPDRFFGTEREKSTRKRNEYALHDDWYEPIMYRQHPFEDGPACNDFFCGNLKGITEKLPYLKELGIGTLYLNPIFEAYSNHRYDTANYKKIDEILGTEEDFKNLCDKAERMGIHIILDGVFSHTGSDSIYFNKYGNYGETNGAYRDENSPYRKWYSFDENGGYESWWGCSNLPNVKETEPTYLDYILRDEDSVVKHWIKAGAKGWRLDVADELPDEFIKTLRKEVKKQDKDAVIIGEVWEDASNKVSYDKLREYLLGDELDSVMNYPFKDNMIEFIMGKISAETLSKRIMSIFENYPKEALYSLMNIAGTHDTMRIKTVLGGENLSMTSTEETLAINRVRLMAFLQMTFVGVPCIYYGDEIGMQGGEDPLNRMPYTWRCIDPELLGYYKRLASVRNSSKVLKSGDFKTVYASDGVFAYTRTLNDKFALCIVNRNAWSETVEIALDTRKNLAGTLGGRQIFCKNGRVKVKIPAFSAEVFA